VSVESSDRLVIDFAKNRHLGWSHYRILLSIPDRMKCRFYFEQAASQRWSVRELSRQIDRALFERVALSRATRALIRLEKQRGPAETVRYENAFKDPYLLDFLGLKGAYSEKDLEGAILVNLQQFLTELGTGSAASTRQGARRGLLAVQGAAGSDRWNAERLVFAQAAQKGPDARRRASAPTPQMSLFEQPA
jgi:predicted nuclease of restriction endonuclease-like (RecB) superfamily